MGGINIFDEEYYNLNIYINDKKKKNGFGGDLVELLWFKDNKKKLFIFIIDKRKNGLYGFIMGGIIIFYGDYENLNIFNNDKKKKIKIGGDLVDLWWV